MSFRGKLTLFRKRKVYHTRQEREEMQTAMNRPQDSPAPLPPTGSKGVLVTTKSKEQDNKTHIVLIVFTHTKNIETGQSECTV